MSTSTAGTSTVYGLHGLTVEINHKKYEKMAEDGEPLFWITTEDDCLYCLQFCYNEEEHCQDIPDDFDFEFESILHVVVPQNQTFFSYLSNYLSALDQLTKVVYKVDGREFTISLAELKALTST